MLKSLYIKNYALIDSLEISFEPGFSVITGETGAGKSIILGALSLILGQRADIKAIKQGENKCIIEGTFDVSEYNLESFCEEYNIEYDPDTYILRREILSSGKSRAFINDTPVSLTDLKELGDQLIDIHSQHQNLILGDSKFQMQVVDILAGTGTNLKEYQKIYKAYKEACKNLDNIKNTISLNKADEDYIRYQFTILNETKLKEGEQEELENEQKLLNHAEDIKVALYKINNYLSNEENGILLNLKEALSNANNITELYPQAKDMAQRIETAYIDLNDLSTETERYTEDVEFDPERLGFIEERLDQIYSLQQKFKVNTIGELIKLSDEFQRKLQNIDSCDAELEAQQEQVNKLYENMFGLAEKLSKARKNAVPEVESLLMEKIAGLGMPNIKFECSIVSKSIPDQYGIDDLRFLFSANKNIPLQPIAEVASGGEISRVMLCLKSMIAGATTLPTIIFDEIDTGVSGEIADKMGQIMHNFGNDMQVIAITHLPQIAAKGKSHYYVYKIEDNTTTTNLKKLSDNERIQEIAQMLSGSQITNAAIENAKVMLGKA